MEMDGQADQPKNKIRRMPTIGSSVVNIEFSQNRISNIQIRYISGYWIYLNFSWYNFMQKK